MNFCSDNVTGVAPEILAAVERANTGPAAAYGDDELSVRVTKKIADVFEREADVFLVTTGTAANSLSLSVMTPPYGEIFCHPEAHIQVDECGAPEFFTGGAKLTHLASDDGKIHAADLGEVLSAPDHGVHHVQAAAVSFAQASEAGTVYGLDEVREISDIAHEHGLKVHMDGARFANALVSLGCSAAEASWKAGVDILCFGASKNGALAAEAVVIFDKAMAETFAFRRKRGGHLISKMRFLAAQFDAYLEDDLWLKLARHANAATAKLTEGLKGVPGVSFMYTPQANEIFAELPEAVIQGLEGDGFGFYRWPGDGAKAIRLVTAFNTRAEDVDAFIASAKRHAK
ncbi:MAG: low specificity L-threonine aldolase [Rhodospirillales bacterium]|jgi:threonine aldolase|nr:low specificity L-threonine aldolase [Rhodospirillales bacterium]